MNSVAPSIPRDGGAATNPSMRLPGRTVVPAGQTEPVRGPAPVGQWHRDGIKIVVYDASAVPPRAAGGYVVLHAGTLHASHAYLSALNMVEVLSGGNGMALALRGGHVEAGLYFSRMAVDGTFELMIMGLVSSGAVPGLAAPLVAAAAIAEIVRAGVPVSARAIVRVMPDGEVNAPSSKALSKAGFFPVRFASNDITPEHAHLHLSASEYDGRFLTLEMAATHADLIAAAERTLADWSRAGSSDA